MPSDSNTRKGPFRGPFKLPGTPRSADEAQAGAATPPPPGPQPETTSSGAESVSEQPEESGERGGAPTPPLSPLLPTAEAAPAAAAPVVLDDGDEGDDVYTPAPRSSPVVEALREAGLYQHALGSGRHRIACPWAVEHAEGPSTQAFYAEPEAANPIGVFRCVHAHAERRDAASLIAHLRLTPAAARGRPRIRVFPGEVDRTSDRTEQVLAADDAYFHAGGPIVRVVERDGVLASELVNDQTLAAILSSKIEWEKPGRANELVRCDPPHNVVQLLMRRQDRPHLPKLEGLARQPFYGPDRVLITSPGYHRETGIYAAFDKEDYEFEVPPGHDPAEHALQYLKWLLGEFPFASDADMSAALAAMLTAAVRPTLPQAPAFSITATRSGSGKSYLANVIALLAGPGDPHNVSYPTNADEATKVVLAMLLERPAVIHFDDMQTDWKSFGALNKALTSPTTTERVLGSSRTATARTNVLFLGTGNNIEPVQDMRRRVVSIRLEPAGETPALRSFRAEGPVEHIRKQRGRVVAAALAIIGGHQAAGRPMKKVPTIGTFEEWSAMCRQPLLWLGEPDPATSLIEQVTNDSDQEALAELLKVWRWNFQFNAVTVRKVVAKAEEHSELMDALAELPIMDGRFINRRRLGWYLRKNAGRRAGGLRIEPGERGERNTWRVVAD